ncbi:subtilisin-like protein [Daedaleopsis nitida]|nr:subtilisin-like protein [Daedaleopsis nitida]
MAFSKLLFCLATLAVTAVATPLRVVHGSRDVPHGWSLHRRADPDALVPLKFSLVQSNLHNLNAFLLDVADPYSPNYGKHWSHAKVADTFRPSKESVDTVHSWLIDDLGLAPHKVQLNGNRDALQLNVTVAEAESILGTEYYVYRFDDEGHETLGCHKGYALPEHVSKHVDLVWPTTHLKRPRLGRRDSSRPGTPGFSSRSGIPKIAVKASQLEAMGCDQSVTLDCLRDLYNFDYEPVAGDKNTVGVAEWEQEIYQQSDLDLFFQMYEPSSVGVQPKLVTIEGESELDIELMMGLIGPKQNLTVYEVGQTSSAQQPIDELIAAFDASYCEVEGVSNQGLTDCGDKPVPNVISISYHFEPDYLNDAVTPIVQRGCTEMGKLSLTGVTFVASSGDGGVGYSGAEECLVNGTLTAFASSGSFVGQFPASCPYVTAVGATSVAPGNSVSDPEIATTRFPSGGGFSNNFAMPDWQKDAVTNYVTNFAPPYADDIYNRSGRAYPDVGANGWPLAIAESGQFFLSGGTSASAPIFASVVAMINDARIAAGKGPVGFINPTLYSSLLAGAFNDVTNGTNPGCGTQGFVAAPGWDPITGLGTPNFQKLKDAFMTLP